MIAAQDVARFLPRVLSSARRVADEIVVVDGGSRDATPEIACREPRAHLVTRAFTGNIAEQKNFGLDHCTCDWILVLDADELLSDQLCERIPILIRTWTRRWYKVPRYWLLDDRRPFRYVASPLHYPDYQLRLFRNMAVFRYLPERPIHIRFPKAGRGLGKRLDRGHILHFALAFLSRAEREERAHGYETIEPGAAATNRIYLYEDRPHEVRSCVESLTEEGQ